MLKDTAKKAPLESFDLLRYIYYEFIRYEKLRSKEALMKRDIKNIFRFGDVVEGSHFTNRSKEIKELRAIINSGQNIVLLSPGRRRGIPMAR